MDLRRADTCQVPCVHLTFQADLNFCLGVLFGSVSYSSGAKCSGEEISLYECIYGASTRCSASSENPENRQVEKMSTLLGTLSIRPCIQWPLEKGRELIKVGVCTGIYRPAGTSCLGCHPLHHFSTCMETWAFFFLGE